jgi:hypothetical protein
MENHLLHYEIPGNAIVEAFIRIKTAIGKLVACCFTSGSAATIGRGDCIKEVFPLA